MLNGNLVSKFLVVLVFLLSFECFCAFLTRLNLTAFVYFAFLPFCLMVVLVRLSVPVQVQVIYWNDSSPKYPILCRVGR